MLSISAHALCYMLSICLAYITLNMLVLHCCSCSELVLEEPSRKLTLSQEIIVRFLNIAALTATPPMAFGTYLNSLMRLSLQMYC